MTPSLSVASPIRKLATLGGVLALRHLDHLVSSVLFSWGHDTAPQSPSIVDWEDALQRSDDRCFELVRELEAVPGECPPPAPCVCEPPAEPVDDVYDWLEKVGISFLGQLIWRCALAVCNRLKTCRQDNGAGTRQNGPRTAFSPPPLGRERRRGGGVLA